jgi:predicted transcriptional regulator
LRRSRFEIIGEILSLTADGAGGAAKTSIVYRANLNFNVVNRYLDLLTGEGLVSVRRGSAVRYRITERGRKFLDAYKNLKAIAENL